MKWKQIIQHGWKDVRWKIKIKWAPPGHNHYLIFIAINGYLSNVENFGWTCTTIFVMYCDNISQKLKWIWYGRFKNTF
jgi:hypothetical protein